MARKNEFEQIVIEHRDKKTKKIIKTEKVKNIVTLKCANDETHYYANFMVDGVSYQKKNLTKYFGSKTLRQAKEHLADAKSDIRKGINPFDESMGKKVKDIVLKSINNRKPMNQQSAYKKSIEGFYNKYIDPVIGHLFLGKVSDRHVEIIMKSLEGYRKEYKQNLQILMYSIFEKEFRKGNIKHNPFYDLYYGKHRKKTSFDIRLNEPIEDVARKLYRSALEYNPKYRLILLMSVMTVRRIGEIHQLRLGNIRKSGDGHWYILATRDITKTDIDEKYPIPTEIVNLLPLDLIDADEYSDTLLFDFSMSSILLNYKKLVKEAKIDINKGYSLTSHDNRKLFLSILSHTGTDSDLADGCLSHSPGNIKGEYLDIPYNIRKGIFEDWWAFLRGIC